MIRFQLSMRYLVEDKTGARVFVDIKRVASDEVFYRHTMMVFSKADMHGVANMVYVMRNNLSDTMIDIRHLLVFAVRRWVP